MAKIELDHCDQIYQFDHPKYLPNTYTSLPTLDHKLVNYSKQPQKKNE